MNNYIWINRAHEKLSAKDIDRTYLYNISNFILRGNNAYIKDMTDAAIRRLVAEFKLREIPTSLNVGMLLKIKRDMNGLIPRRIRYVPLYGDDEGLLDHPGMFSQIED